MLIHKEAVVNLKSTSFWAATVFASLLMCISCCLKLCDFVPIRGIWQAKLDGKRPLAEVISFFDCRSGRRVTKSESRCELIGTQFHSRECGLNIDGGGINKTLSETEDVWYTGGDGGCTIKSKLAWPRE